MPVTPTTSTIMWCLLVAVYSHQVLSLSPYSASQPEPQKSSDSTTTTTTCDSVCFRGNISDGKTINFVCGSDGFTYLNFEEMDCVRRSCKRNIHLRQYGRCPRETYSAENGGLGQSETLTSTPTVDRNLLHFLSQVSGEAETVPRPMIFPSESYNPVVGGGYHYQRSEGGMLPAILGSRRSKKICIPDECDCGNEELRPVCGSDSVTYGSQCLMECNQECHPDVVKYHDGHCGKLFLKGSCRPDECGCPEELQPVCGSDFVTYGNRCLLECSKNCNPDIRFNYDGFCGRLFFPKSQQLPTTKASAQ